jgi:hypothetical protein
MDPRIPCVAIDQKYSTAQLGKGDGQVGSRVRFAFIWASAGNDKHPLPLPCAREEDGGEDRPKAVGHHRRRVGKVQSNVGLALFCLLMEQADCSPMF